MPQEHVLKIWAAGFANAGHDALSMQPMDRVADTCWGSTQAKQRKDVRLYYGTFNPDRTAYKESFAQWEAAGIKVIMVYSDDELGYIQDAFEKVYPQVGLALSVAADSTFATISIQTSEPQNVAMLLQFGRMAWRILASHVLCWWGRRRCAWQSQTC